MKRFALVALTAIFAVTLMTVVSSAEETSEENMGACHQALLRSRWKIETSSNWATRNAEPEAIAMRGVANQIERITATAKPATTTSRARCGPKARLERSVTRKATG